MRSVALVERVPAAHATLHQASRRGRITACNAMQPEAARGPQKDAVWCRPLSGCAPSLPPHGDGLGSGAQLPPAAAAQLLPPVVALGKFDALHKGHRALAAAAAQLGGAPWLVSFSGMAEVLGWPARLPLVAPCDRRRVLAAWAPHCQGRVPQECAVPFAEVRTMSPEAFVELLASELRVSGVVVGSNYRFGYRAAGTTKLLQQLGPQHGMRVRVLGLVGDSQAAAGAAAARGTPAAAAAAAAGGTAEGAAEQQQEARGGQHAAPAGENPAQQQRQQGAEHTPQQRAADRKEAHDAVSSSRVRHALSCGDVAEAALCLGRPYRLVASLAEDPASSALPDGAALRLPAAALLNQPPRAGRYRVAAAVTGRDTLDQLLPPREAELGVDEAGVSLHGCGGLLGELPAGARHLTLDFL